MKRVLITGHTGLIGSHLSAYLTDQGYEVSGISRSTSHSRLQNIKGYRGDILDKVFLKKVFTDYKPDVVYHLAAQAFNGQSWQAEDTTYLTNIQGSRNVFEACRDYAPNARILPACSSAAYGGDDFPIQEVHSLHPITPYGVTKATMEMMAYQFHKNYNLDIVFPRLFIHVGINHPHHTFIQNICRQVAKCECVEGGIITVSCGNIHSTRDYVDIRDGVKALHLLQEKAETGKCYNVCSGVGYTGVKIIEALSDLVGEFIAVKDSIDERRPSDEQMLIGDPTRINTLGWRVEIPMENTLKWVLRDWRDRV